MRTGPDMMLELACGPGPVCGVDEAGRGPWAGPVSAGAVILDPDRVPKGLNDSKKLTAKARAALEEEIKAVAIAWGVSLLDGPFNRFFDWLAARLSRRDRST